MLYLRLESLKNISQSSINTDNVLDDMRDEGIYSIYGAARVILNVIGFQLT